MGSDKRKEKLCTSAISLPDEIVLGDGDRKSSGTSMIRCNESRSDRSASRDSLVGFAGRNEGYDSMMVDDDSFIDASPLDCRENRTMSKSAFCQRRSSLNGARTPIPNTYNFDRSDKGGADSITAQLTPNTDSDTDSGSISTHPDTSSMTMHTFEQDTHTENRLSLCSQRDLPLLSEKQVKRLSISNSTFAAFRMNYLIVHIAIMLADGLQGTHLYVLYEGYGYSVATLYSLGFISGAITSPFIGPLVDRIGRKKAAIIYCLLEVAINLMEQYPLFIGLIFSRVIGGVTTNLLFSVFESWLVTEHRKLGFPEEKLEIILRDSTIVSNTAAIVSGYIAHYLASMFGPVGPFEGAVSCTWCALVLVGMLWTENFGSETLEVISFRDHMVGAFRTIVGDSKISRIGLIQGLTEGSLQTFVFLWSPALRSFSPSAPHTALGLDCDGEPAYGLIFGAFMACGVIGGVIEPAMRNSAVYVAERLKGPRSGGNKSAAEVGFLCAACYFLSAILLFTPCLVEKDSPYSFSICLLAFMLYEVLVGVYMPCEGVLRSIFMPNKSTCSIMTMLRVIVNAFVALGVISTNYLSFTTAFSALSVMMISAACLQLSLLSRFQCPISLR